jgi:hypothetical protein
MRGFSPQPHRSLGYQSKRDFASPRVGWSGLQRLMSGPNTSEGIRESSVVERAESLPPVSAFWPSCFAALLVLCGACAQANLVHVTDAAPEPRDGSTLDSSPPVEASMTCPAPNRACSGTVPTATCDPVCQTGSCDWCSQKCTYALDGGSAQPACASKKQKTPFQACTVTFSGSPQQFDDCAPGSICLAPTIGDQLTYCFGLCRLQADCLSGVGCGQRTLSPAGGSVGVCDPPYDQCGVDGKCCDPLGGSGCDTSRVCLLVSPDGMSGHSRTVCEFAYGNGRNSSPCNSSRDCLLKNTCVKGLCKQVCNSTNPCPDNGTCAPFGSEYGYCPN